MRRGGGGSHLFLSGGGLALLHGILAELHDDVTAFQEQRRPSPGSTGNSPGKARRYSRRLPALAAPLSKTLRDKNTQANLFSSELRLQSRHTSVPDLGPEHCCSSTELLQKRESSSTETKLLHNGVTKCQSRLLWLMA